ncbi:MAG: ferrochelatase [Coriobacteriia bacterium]|nr:ferrochelatase [Coriobacteriia bacterium]
MALSWAWLALLLGAVGAGAALVALLIAPPRYEPPAFAGAAGMVAMSGWGLVLLSARHGSVGAAVLSGALGLAAFLGGYLLAASMLPLLARSAPPAPLPRVEGDPARSPAYVLLSRAEPERYHPRWAAATVAEVSGSGSMFVPVALLPFLFAAQKARYRLAQGRSPARQTVLGLAQRSARALGVPEVRVAWCEPPGSLAEAVHAAAQAGCSRIVVATLAVAEGHPEERAKMALDALKPGEAGLEILYTQPMWSSERLAGLVAGRASSFADGSPEAGVTLVMEAQPPAWEGAHEEFDRQEAAFAGRVRTLIAEGGVPGERIRTAWADWRTPDVTETVRHLAALGCERVAVVPAGFPTETLVTMLDLARGAELARTEAAVQLLPPWGNDPAVAEELVSRMREAASGRSE